MALAAGVATVNPVIGGVAGVVCGIAMYVCSYNQEKFNKSIDETIAAIKAACAEGDEECYDAVIAARYPGWATVSSGDGGVTGDAQSSGSAAPSSGASPSGPTTPEPKLPEGNINMGETPPTGGEFQPIDPCKANPKATGCRRPPKQEM